MTTASTANEEQLINAKLYINEQWAKIELMTGYDKTTFCRVINHYPTLCSAFLDKAFNDIMIFIKINDYRIDGKDLDHYFTEAYNIYQMNGNKDNYIGLKLERC